jgi:hypothetical protein
MPGRKSAFMAIHQEVSGVDFSDPRSLIIVSTLPVSGSIRMLQLMF